MEQLPVEVIGIILSLLGGARDGIVASTTCKKWREAWLNHLHSLSFDSMFHAKYSTSQLEIIITETIFQTTGLQCLSISMGEDDEDSSDDEYSSSDEDSSNADVAPFSAATVIAWLMYTRDTLRRLCFNAKTLPSINILEKCGKQKKLEDLVLRHIPIAGVGLNYRALKSLSLIYVSISSLNLSLLLTNCPKLEALSLIAPNMSTADMQGTMKLTSASLKNIFVESLNLDKFVLEADSIEDLHLKDCTLELFELVGKGSLRALHIDDSSEVTDLDMGENTGNLEVFDVRDFTISWPRFYKMISRSSKLRKLRLWGVEFGDEYNSPFDLESILFAALS